MFPQTWNLLVLVWCSAFLKIMKQWSKWSSKAEVQRWDTCHEPTELRLIVYLTESTWTHKSKSNMLTPKARSQTHWQRAISHVMSGTLFSICSISAFSAQQAVPKRCRKEWYRRRENCGKVEADVEPGLAFWGNLSHSAELECIQSPGDTPNTQSTRLESHSPKCRETCRWSFKSKWRSVKFSSVANRCKVERTCEETRCCRHEPGSEFSRTCKETCRWRFRYQRRGLEVTAQCRISRADVPHLEKVYSNLRQQLKRKPEDKMEDLNVNTLIWRMFLIVTQQAAVHLGTGYLENLHAININHKEQWNNCSM